MSGLNYEANDTSCLALNHSSHWLFRRDLTMYWAFVNLYGRSSLYKHVCTFTPIHAHLYISYEASTWGGQREFGACCWELSTCTVVKGRITMGKHLWLGGSSILVSAGSIFLIFFVNLTNIEGRCGSGPFYAICATVHHWNMHPGEILVVTQLISSCQGIFSSPLTVLVCTCA